jgi:TetR/AcrR family transcriptional regulator, transcriptional repressor for nem operon
MNRPRRFGFAGDSPRVGAEAQSYFAGGLDNQITILAGLIAEHGSIAETGERRTLRERAISLHCEMVGALVLSRSVAQAAPALSNEILENVQQDITASLDLLSSRTSTVQPVPATRPPNLRSKPDAPRRVKRGASLAE